MMLLSFLFINSYQLTRAEIQSQSDQKDLDTLIQRHCEYLSDWFQDEQQQQQEQGGQKVRPGFSGHRWPSG